MQGFKMEKRKNIKNWVALFCVYILIGMGTQPLQAASEEIENTQNGEGKRSIFLKHDTISSSRPFQAHIMLTGSGRHSDRSVNPGAAIHLGYRFSELMHLGWTSQAFYNDDSICDDHDDKRYDDERVFGQEGAKKTTARTDPRHLLEMRFFPWQFGLYFSAGLMHNGYEKTVTEFKSRPRVINENEYDTGLTTTLEYEAWSGAAAGIGFNFLFANGFSLASGINVGLGVQTPDVTIASDVVISTTDLAEWKAQIEENEKRIPVMFHVGVGYAF
jgi:hypothetical protein